MAWNLLDAIFRSNRCPHGVKKSKPCDTCVREQHEARAEQLRWQVLVEKREKLDRDADALRQTEGKRLSQIVPTLTELRKLTPQKFEDKIAEMFKRLGYDVEQTPYSHDHGRDGILRKNGKKILYECKRYGEDSASGRRDLQILHSAMKTDEASAGFFISTGSFTRHAIEFAQTHSIEPIDGATLVKKYFESIKHGPQTDQYRSMCRQCGEIVQHHLRKPEAVKCQNGHVVQPTLRLEKLLSGEPVLTGTAKGALVPSKATIRAFEKAGFGTVSQGDVATMHWWLRHGYQPLPGSKSIRVGGMRFFHKSQLRELTLEEKAAIAAQSEQL